MERIVRAVMDMDKATMLAELELVFRDFETRHWQTRSIFRQRYAEIEQLLGLDPSQTSDEKKELIGAYFCHENSYAAAALMNPSVVPHPDQSGLRPGCQRIRSEEHTSELQSLMRISYAVFCLKKKNTHVHQRYKHYNHR